MAVKIPLTTAEAARVPLKVTVVGAGLGGLACAIAFRRRGHEVTIFEAAAQIAEIGAGIQVSPNLSRLLNRWGIGSTLEQAGCALNSIDVRRWADGSVMSNAPMMPQIGKKYGANMYVVHRADFQNTLLEAARQSGVSIRLGSTVVDADFDSASITLSSGEHHKADFLVGGDGVRSSLRKKFLKTVHQEEDHVRPTGDSAYRAVLDTASLKTQPDLYALATQMKGTRWVGPGCHVIGYPIRSGATYNMVMIHPDKHGDAPDSWTTKGSKAEVLKTYQGWDPILLKFLDHLEDDKIYEWRLADHEELPAWSTGRFALIGDACHPTLPYVAQGSAQAIEDAAALAATLSLIESNSPSQISRALAVYESLRKKRAEDVVNTAGALRHTLHLPDGPEQRTRDAAFAQVKAGGKNPDSWQDDKCQKDLFGHDAEAGVLDAWNQIKHGQDIDGVGGVDSPSTNTRAQALL